MLLIFIIVVWNIGFKSSCWTVLVENELRHIDILEIKLTESFTLMWRQRTHSESMKQPFGLQRYFRQNPQRMRTNFEKLLLNQISSPCPIPSDIKIKSWTVKNSSLPPGYTDTIWSGCQLCFSTLYFLQIRSMFFLINVIGVSELFWKSIPSSIQYHSHFTRLT